MDEDRASVWWTCSIRQVAQITSKRTDVGTLGDHVI